MSIAFATIKITKKFQSQTEMREKLTKTLSYKKTARIMLMKSTPIFLSMKTKLPEFRPSSVR